MKILLTLITLTIIIIACDPAPCEVETYLLDPIQMKLYKGFPDSTSYQQLLLLNSINYETKIFYDTLDTMIIPRIDTFYNCNLTIDNLSYTLYEKDSIQFGNPNPGGTFSLMKLRVDKINPNIEAIDISLWKYRFIQDCSNW